MDYAMIGTIARLTNTTPNWDREVTRAVGAARACAIAACSNERSHSRVGNSAAGKSAAERRGRSRG